MVSRLVPDKNLAKKVEREINLEVLKQVGGRGKEFAQRVIAEIKSPNKLRDFVRPFLTYGAYGLYVYVKVTVVLTATKI